MSRPMKSLSEEDTDTDDSYPADNELSSNLPMHADDDDADDRENQPPPVQQHRTTPLPPPTPPRASSSSSPIKRPSHKRHRPSPSASSPVAAAPCPASHDPSLVLLDIGGVLFKTSRATLLSLPNTYFTAHLTFPQPTTTPHHHTTPPTHTTPTTPTTHTQPTPSTLHSHTTSPLFIDRDSAHFRHVLNYLRDRSLPDGLTVREMSELHREATYYAMDELVQHIERVRADVKWREDEAERRRETERVLLQHANASVGDRQLAWPNRSSSNPLQSAGMAAGGGGGMGPAGVHAVQRAMSTAAADSFQLDADF